VDKEDLLKLKIDQAKKARIVSDTARRLAEEALKAFIEAEIESCQADIEHREALFETRTASRYEKKSVKRLVKRRTALMFTNRLSCGRYVAGALRTHYWF
jgi:hypothetical protein